MKTTYKYIHFESANYDFNDKPVYYCRNNKGMEFLGDISWYPSWRQYCYFPNRTPNIATVYSSDCLADIQDFLNQLNRGER